MPTCLILKKSVFSKRLSQPGLGQWRKGHQDGPFLDWRYWSHDQQCPSEAQSVSHVSRSTQNLAQRRLLIMPVERKPNMHHTKEAVLMTTTCRVIGHKPRNALNWEKQTDQPPPLLM